MFFAPLIPPVFILHLHGIPPTAGKGPENHLPK
jgi:hypothetical protein